MYVFPTDQQIEEFTSGDLDLPILMVNLVRFRENAFYPDGSGHAPCAGREAFEERYAKNASIIAEKIGARLLIGEAVKNIFIGPTDENWDRFYLIWYPNTQVFLDLLASPAYLELAIHRVAGLLDSRIYKCDGSGVDL